MGVIPSVGTDSKRGSHKAFYETITAGDTCEPADLLGFRDITIQVTGTFDSCVITLTGSNDGTNYSPVNDIHGDAVSLAAAGVSTVEAGYKHYKPVATAGTTVDLDVTLMGSK